MIRLPMLLAGAAALLLPACASFPDTNGGGRVVRAADLASEMPRRWSYDLGDPAFAAFLDRADLGSLDVKAALARAAASDAALRAARSGGRPKIDAVSGWQRAIAGPDRAAGGVDVGVTAEWTPDLSGEISAAVEAAHFEARAAGHEVEAARARLAAELARAWLALAASDDRLARIARREVMENEGAGLARRRIAAGYATRDELLLRQTALARLADERLIAKNERETVRLRLLALAGLAPDEHFDAPRSLSALTPFEPPLLSLDDLNSRPDVLAAAEQLAAADMRRLEAIRSARPRLVLSLAGQGGNLSLSRFFENPGFGLIPGVRLEGAIFDGGRARARADRAAAEGAEVEALYLKTLRGAQQDLATALSALVSAQQRQRPAADAVRHARERLRLVDSRFAGGTASRLDRIDSEQQLVEAEDAAAQARRAIIAAGVETYAALVGGS
ncbi:MAG: TolC family protein [Sphingopyxis sp.]|uniref:TolC family protein n=1 Tax=Sphingopyxis sp. TaxID=1908224 RepID=UPI002ABAB109|nr:TolC family protein [Sphingopyxis sp.]MDZ3833603.1 TolC family protein [Sphingopyxis sp.]